MVFFLKIILILNLEETNLAGQEKKIYSDLTFSQYNHIQNFEDKKLFQHFANLIKIRSTHLLPIFYLFFFWSLVYVDLIIHPLLEGGGGYTVLPLSVCLSVRPSKIFFVAFFSATIDGRNLIFLSQVSYRYPISWEAFLDLLDSYFLFADLVGFYTHWTYMHIFLNNYWWQKSGIWSQASYRYPISWEVAGVS